MNEFNIACKENVASRLSERLETLFYNYRCNLTKNGNFSHIDTNGKYRIIDAEITFSEEEVRYENGGEIFNTYQIRLQVETIKQGKKRWVNFNI